MLLSRGYGKGAARAVAALLLAAQFVPANAVYLIDTDANIKATAKSVAADLLTRYHGDEPGQNPGILPGPPADGLGPYYWWQGGAMMGTLIDYWHFTGDGSYNNLVMQGMLHQAGGDSDYMTENYTLSLGNDDQAFWGMSAMLAAETRFPNPPSDKPQWLALAQAVWATQADPSRHDDECGGGLHWQIPESNNGYDYKNTIANGCFFNLGARLARYTDNSTYAKWAEESWDWIWKVQYIDHDSWLVYDGGHTGHDCKDINKLTYSYNAGVLIQGLAFMYNYTKGEDKWKQRLDKLVDASIKQFFPKGALFEPNCEFKIGQCGTDMLTYKGFVHRWMAGATQMAPFLSEKILPVLQKSAEKAVSQCTGGPQGKTCGFYWSSGKFVDPGVHQTDGAGEAMSVLAAVSGLLVGSAKSPVTNSTGGISKGNDGSGHSTNGKKKAKPITTADRAGAWIITVLCFGVFIAGFFWVSMGGE